MAFGRQVRLLLWKNWLLQKRRICVTVFEIILPIAFAVLFVGIRSLVKPEEYPDPTYYDPPINIAFADPGELKQFIGYVPQSSETDQVMKYVQSVLQPQRSNIQIKPFDTEDNAVAFYRQNTDKMHQIVVFNGVTNTTTRLPQNLTVAIRPFTGSSKWRTEFTFPIFQTNEPREDSDRLYQMRGVLAFQGVIGAALAMYWLEKEGQPVTIPNFGVYTKRLAYPPYFNDPLIAVIQSNLPLFIILSFILSVIINTKNLVYEKERKLKESMKLMGLSAAAHWVSWFITFSIYLIPAIILYAMLLGIDIVPEGPVLANSDITLFFVFLLCYSLALISFCFMVSTFVQKANVGAALAGILYFAFFFPYYFVQPNYEDMGKNLKLVSGLLFNCALSLGANCIGILEGTGVGARWDNFYEPGTVDDNLSLLECMLLLLVDTVIHLVIFWYLDNIRPGEFGVPKPFYFCFTKSYWCGEKRRRSDSLYEHDHQGDRHFEKEPSGREAGIQICNLKKKFGLRYAVAGTSLNMYEGQITVLLGHNGAGKTTTMSMLTGFIPPTSGTAKVNGYDIRSNIDGVRQSLGLCPQHNILFDSLTVEEHLKFFAKLKGMSGRNVDAEVVSMAQEVELAQKFRTRSENLSGGQKRKLSVGIALIGGSKVVILDEPTSGMDPAARRQTWNVLQKARQSRTLLLSTHYMDEADLLGDRIAIMAEGVVKCCGSPLFLKKLYGAGYHLVAVKTPDCNINKLTSFVQSYVGTAELETIINTEVSYILPDNESSKFPDLFEAMDREEENLGITSFGTTATTMEEVFLRVGEHAYDEDDAKPSESSASSSSASNSSADMHFENPDYSSEKAPLLSAKANGHYGSNGIVEPVNISGVELDCSTPNTNIMDFNASVRKVQGLSLELTRMYAVFVKKALHTGRNRTVSLVQLLLPVIFTILGLAVDEARPTSSTEPPLTFNLNPFGKTYIPFTAGIDHNSPDDKRFIDLYGNQFGSSEYLENFNLTGEYSTFDNYTVDRAKELGTATFNRRMVIGMEIKNPQGEETRAATAYYNGQPYHSQPIAVNYVINTFLQFILNDESISLQTSINPLPKNEKDDARFNLILALGSGFSVGFFISFGMSFLTTMFIYFLVKERQVGAKHMQVVSGVGPETYWLPTFAWDFINYIVPSLILLIVFLAYDKEAYLGNGRWALVVLVLVVYGWAVLPFMYAFQFAFSSPPTGVVTVIMLNIVTGLVTTLTVFILEFPGLDTEDEAKVLNWLFMILFPNYNLATCFSNIYTNYLSIQFCKETPGGSEFCTPSVCKNLPFCIVYEDSYVAWDKPGIGANLFFMALQGVVCILIVMLIEYHVFQRLGYLFFKSGREQTEDYESRISRREDNDVQAERERINSSNPEDLARTDSLLLVNLFKSYGHFIAVDNISVGVPEQECFGLLGQNGAGKTTTFKMLTGNVMVTGGNGYLKGFDVRNNIKHVQANMGYCPQFDALIDQMTGRETLTMYARLRGVDRASIKRVVDYLLEVLMLQPHADKLVGFYSGGNKRKLSTAVALIGDPSFIMLDEPSSGMDPKARRQLWNVLSQVRASGRTLVLTSHSMEECDALCTRLAIMVNGRFMCLGSPQHLKNKFGQGYTLIAKLGLLENGTTAPNQPVIQFITENFSGAKVFDDHEGYVHFQVPEGNIKLAQVFSLMESTKESYHVEDYSVHQTTLEQVFLMFTRAQIPPTERTAINKLEKVCCFMCRECGCL